MSNNEQLPDSRVFHVYNVAEAMGWKLYGIKGKNVVGSGKGLIIRRAAGDLGICGINDRKPVFTETEVDSIVKRLKSKQSSNQSLEEKASGITSQNFEPDFSPSQKELLNALLPTYEEGLFVPRPSLEIAVYGKKVGERSFYCLKDRTREKLGSFGLTIESSSTGSNNSGYRLADDPAVNGNVDQTKGISALRRFLEEKQTQVGKKASRTKVTKDLSAETTPPLPIEQKGVIFVRDPTPTLTPSYRKLLEDSCLSFQEMPLQLSAKKDEPFLADDVPEKKRIPGKNYKFSDSTICDFSSVLCAPIDDVKPILEEFGIVIEEKDRGQMREIIKRMNGKDIDELKYARDIKKVFRVLKKSLRKVLRTHHEILQEDNLNLPNPMLMILEKFSPDEFGELMIELCNACLTNKDFSPITSL